MKEALLPLVRISSLIIVLKVGLLSTAIAQSRRASTASNVESTEVKAAIKEARDAEKKANEAATEYRQAKERLERSERQWSEKQENKAEYYYSCTTHSPAHIATKAEIDAKKYPDCKNWVLN